MLASVGQGARALEPRVQALVGLLESEPTLDAASAAQQVGLSESRMLRLLSAETGTTVCRLRQWQRLLATTRLYAATGSVTDAAMAA